MRSGALAGLALVAVLALPVLLVLTVKAPYPVADEAPAPARVWAGEPVARAAVEAPAPSVTPIVAAVADPAPTRAASAPAAAGARERAPALSLDLIPVLDDESGALTIEEPTLPAAPAVKLARPARAAAARAPRTP
ncbi:hypothetical protein ACLBWX_10735 [Methylobacterium sp. M6A4_1b]